MVQNCNNTAKIFNTSEEAANINIANVAPGQMLYCIDRCCMSRCYMDKCCMNNGTGQLIISQGGSHRLEMASTVLSLRGLGWQGGWVKIKTKAISVQQDWVGTEIMYFVLFSLAWVAGWVVIIQYGASLALIWTCKLKLSLAITLLFFRVRKIKKITDGSIQEKTNVVISYFSLFVHFIYSNINQ